jgi:hypothetical protein
MSLPFFFITNKKEMSMSTRYSKKIITRTIIDESAGESRKYTANKLSAKEVSVEGFKLLRAVMPSFGAAIDAFSEGDSEFLPTTNKFSEILFFLSENLTDEHFSNLEDKLLGSLIVDDKELGVEWSDHFDDHPQDFLEILGWLGEENFKSFFMESTIIAPLQKRITPVFQNLKDKLGYVLTDNETDSSEK